MRTLIAVNDSLDVASRDDFNPVNPLAGQNFDIFYAGSAGYIAGTKPSPNLEGLFLENGSVSLSDTILSLNEDFAAFALSPISSELNIGGHGSAAYENIKQAVRKLQLGFGLLQIPQSSSSLPAPYGGASGTGVREIESENLRRIAGEIGQYYGGATGRYFAESLIDWKFSSDALVDAVFQDTIGAIADYAGKLISRGGTIASNIGGLGASFLIKELFTEIYEVATGKDISFGFGGERLANLKTGGAGLNVYSKPLSFSEWLDSLFSNTTELVDSNFRPVGSYNSSTGTYSLFSGAQFNARGESIGYVGGAAFGLALATLGFGYALSALQARSGAATTSLVSLGGMAAGFAAAALAQKPLTYGGYTYQTKTDLWRAPSGKSIATSTLAGEIPEKKKFASPPLEQFDNSTDDELQLAAQNSPDFNMYWEITPWKEIRPVLRLIDLDADEVGLAIDALVTFYEHLIVFSSSSQTQRLAEKAAMEISAEKNRFMIAAYEQEKFLMNRIANYETKRRKKGGKSELYPIIYL